MLGRLMGWDRWTWSVFGKHPSARDYFETNLASPMVRAFARWVDDGFNKVAPAKRRERIMAWRFWSRGGNKRSLICGLVKSSGDGIGRSYPLVLMGQGRLYDWEPHWHLLPFALDATWGKLEYLAARRIDQIGRLEDDLRRMPTPAADWKQLHTDAAIGPPSQKIGDPAMEDIQDRMCTMLLEEKLTIPLRQKGQQDQLQVAGAWNRALKDQCRAAPSTVFIGGSLETTVAIFFNRPLIADDFAELWSVQ